jgi:hypothetical protein
MIERVARALFAVENSFPGACTWEDECAGETSVGLREYWIRSARAAIAALREPTEAMIAAGDDAPPNDLFASEKASRLRYQAMIDAALLPKASSLPDRGINRAGPMALGRRVTDSDEG